MEDKTGYFACHVLVVISVGFFVRIVELAFSDIVELLLDYLGKQGDLAGKTQRVKFN